jgi:hypothetical protein
LRATRKRTVDLLCADGEPLLAFANPLIFEGLFDKQFNSMCLFLRARVGLEYLVIWCVCLVGRKSFVKIYALANLGLVAILDDVDMCGHSALSVVLANSIAYSNEVTITSPVGAGNTPL